MKAGPRLGKKIKMFIAINARKASSIMYVVINSKISLIIALRAFIDGEKRI